MGVRVTDTTPEMRMAAEIVTANSRNSRPRMPPMNRTGMNTAASDVVMARIVNPISFDPLRAAGERRFAGLEVAHDVFEHHDRIVDDEADGGDERHHGEIVEAVVEGASSR